MEVKQSIVKNNTLLKRLLLSLFWFLTDYIGNHIVSHIPFWIIRKLFYRLCGAKIGEGTQFDMNTTFLDPNRLHVGNHCHINRNCLIDARGDLEIKDNVSISHRVTIMTGSHDYRSKNFRYVKSKIYIEDFVWIGVNATIIGNVRIGKGAVVCAGAVVTKDVAPYTVVAGIPAKKIGDRPQVLEYTILKELYPYPQFT